MDFGAGSAQRISNNATVVTIPQQYRQMFQEAATRNGLPVNILALVVQAESGFNPNAVGDNGSSYGFGQIHLPAHPGITADQALDPAFNINWIAQSLGQAYKRYNGNTQATILFNNCPVCADHYASTGSYGPTQALASASQRYLGLVMKPIGGASVAGTVGTEWLSGSSTTDPSGQPSKPPAGSPYANFLTGFKNALAGTTYAGSAPATATPEEGMLAAVGTAAPLSSGEATAATQSSADQTQGG